MRGGPYTAWHLATGCAPPGGVCTTGSGLQRLAPGGGVGSARQEQSSRRSIRRPGAWRCGLNRQAVYTDFAWRRLGLR